MSPGPKDDAIIIYIETHLIFILEAYGPYFKYSKWMPHKGSIVPHSPRAWD